MRLVLSQPTTRPPRRIGGDRRRARSKTTFACIEETNAKSIKPTTASLPLLESLTGQKFGVDPDAVAKWWADQLGFVYDRPVFREQAHDSPMSFVDSAPLPASPPAPWSKP